MPLGAQKATLLGAAGSGGAGFQAWGGLIHDWVSTTSPVTGPMRSHIFHGTGKFYVTEGEKDVHFMIQAGGGATATNGTQGGGGGGAGGQRNSYNYTTATLPQITVTNAGGPSSDGVYPIVVGSGGARPTKHQAMYQPSGPWDSAPALADGRPSSALGLSASGGASGPSLYYSQQGNPGGSGSGATGNSSSHSGGSGNEGGYTPVEGYGGGNGSQPGWGGNPCYCGGGGGGGLNWAGANGVSSGGGGGAGNAFVFGASVGMYAANGGGGGGCTPCSPNQAGGNGNYGAGPGNPGDNGNGNNNRAAPASGSGAGGGGHFQSSYTQYNYGAAGGSGMVVISYLKD